MRTILLGVALVLACSTSRHAPDAAGASCGGLAGLRCSATEYCDYLDNGCGIADQSGTCQPRPQVCPPETGQPLCGCTGKLYSGACSAHEDGTDLNANGTCPVDATSFACGYKQCVLAAEYCRRERPAAPGPETFTCLALPPGCTGGPGPSCPCLARERCGGNCAGDEKSGLTLTCP